jgi:hypothetical protein
MNIDSDTPLMAAIELLQYFVLFLFSRRALCSLQRPELLNARHVHLRVLAPQRFYMGFDLHWLERELERGVIDVAKDHGVAVDFEFLVFADDFQLPCPDHLLESAVARMKRRYML